MAKFFCVGFMIVQVASSPYDFSKKIHLMGILNITPDSFSDGGHYLKAEQALEHALEMQEQGADFIDVGAESTRPGARAITAQEETLRLKPILNRLVSKIKIPLSIDTRKAQVARFALEEGVSLLNDVSGLQWDLALIDVLRDYPVPLILMHSRGSPESMAQLNHYDDLGSELEIFFEQKLKSLEEFGISRERVVLDPGLGFAKVGTQNVEILAKLSRLKKFARPILIGLSRKSFLESYFGQTTHPKERKLATEVAHVTAILGGANILRVHEVEKAKKTIRFVEDYLKFSA